MVSDEELLSVEEIIETGRMREELAIARRIQRAFLPEAPPDLQGFEIEGWNEPCRETGGDYYDYLRLPGGRLGVAIGDVSGHGIGPALLMANARSALRALLQLAESPADVLGRLNDVLVPDMLEDHFMTMFVGVLDLSTKRFRYAVAGHERPLLLRANGDDFVTLDGKGMPLGIVPGLRYAEGDVVTLRHDDLLVCFTDGLWEATNHSGEMFGHDRMMAALLRARALSAADIVSVVRQEASDFAEGAPQSDDLTLVALKVL
jgi:serine phosphatase RsbU (regulator of sigma subunit)